MKRGIVNGFEVMAAGASLALLVWLAVVTPAIEMAFWSLLSVVAVLNLLVYVTPRPLVRVMSMPFAFRLDQNWGARGFETQAVTYASYHTRWLAGITHVGFAADAVAWTVLLYLVAGWWGVAGLIVFKLVQILSYSDRKVAVLLAAAWIGVGGAGWLVVSLGERAGVAALAMATVVVTAVWRVVGHTVEPVPPGVSGTYRFVPLEDLGLTPTLGASALVGVVAEAASGLPHRLFDFWAVDTASRVFGFRPAVRMGRGEIDRQRALVFRSGWGAAPATRHLVDFGRPAFRSDRRPSALPPFPDGWYAVAFSDDLVPGQILSRTFCGEEVVVFRTVSGGPVVMAAHCPHLGAHLGVGGTVDGEEITCPFHGFRFDPSGTCVATGYGSDPPRELVAPVRSVHETDGIVLAWHGADSGPSFVIPELDGEGWSALVHRSYRLRDHPQETTENAVDLGHFAVVHGYDSVEMLEPVEVDGPSFSVRYAAARPMPWLGPLARPVRFEFAPSIRGLGYSLVHVAIPDLGIEARLLVLATPIDGTHVDLRLGLRLRQIAEPGRVHRLVALVPRRVLGWVVSRSILAGFAGDAGQDFPIWENKAYIERPRLARGDGPIGVYRRWARQFYPERTAADSGGTDITIDLSESSVPHETSP